VRSGGLNHHDRPRSGFPRRHRKLEIHVYSDRHHLTWYYSKSTAQFMEPLLLKANKVLAGEP
jgi:hypothetical protein